MKVTDITVELLNGTTRNHGDVLVTQLPGVLQVSYRKSAIVTGYPLTSVERWTTKERDAE